VRPPNYGAPASHRPRNGQGFRQGGYKAIVTDILEKEGRSVVAEIADAGRNGGVS